MAELFITLGDGRTFHHALGPRPETIGRDATCEIAVDDPSTSRRHARFTPTSRGFTVEDLGSKNGTLVNEQPASGNALRDGDVIQMGAVTVLFRDGAAAPAAGRVTQGMSSVSVVLTDDDATRPSTHYTPRDKRLALSQRRLEMICELSERLTTLQSQERLLEDVMSICFETFRFERGAIGVRRRNQRVVDWPVVRNLRGREGELTISRTLFARAFENGERAIYVDDGSNQVDPSVSMVQQGIRSAMCVPLLHGEDVLGVIYGDRISTSRSYSDEDIDFLAAIARQVSIGLVNTQLMDDQRQMERLNRDIDLARSIQKGLFPKVLPDDSGFRVAALNDPGRRVSGDYYDVIHREDGRIWCLIADVTGEGMAAALLMANLQAAVRVTSGESDDPGHLLAVWNRLICRNTDRTRFITCLLSLIDLSQGTIRTASAGHWAPYLLRGGSAPPEEINLDAGLPLGVEEDAAYETATVTPGPHAFSLFSFTDGVVEAMNGEHQTYGRERLVEALSAEREAPPPQLIKTVRKHVAAFVGPAEQSDDITMIAARVG